MLFITSVQKGDIKYLAGGTLGWSRHQDLNKDSIVMGKKAGNMVLPKAEFTLAPFAFCSFIIYGLSRQRSIEILSLTSALFFQLSICTGLTRHCAAIVITPTSGTSSKEPNCHKFYFPNGQRTSCKFYSE